MNSFTGGKASNLKYKLEVLAKTAIGIKGLGAVKQSVDERDYVYSPEGLVIPEPVLRPGAVYGVVPGSFPGDSVYPSDRITRSQALAQTFTVDLRKTGFLPVVYDQGALGSCMSNAISSAIYFEQKREYVGKTRKTIATEPSRLFLYYNVRTMEGTISCDCGGTMRDGIKSAASQGVCPEAMWSYSVTRFDKRPNQICYNQATKFEVLEYRSIPDSITPEDKLARIKAALDSGHPVVFGGLLFSSFNTDYTSQTGDVRHPKDFEVNDTSRTDGNGTYWSQYFAGGHALVIVGYKDLPDAPSGSGGSGEGGIVTGNTGRFLVRNSWGPKWGMKGYMTMSYDYVCDWLCWDFWVLTKVA